MREMIFCLVGINHGCQHVYAMLCTTGHLLVDASLYACHSSDCCCSDFVPYLSWHHRFETFEGVSLPSVNVNAFSCRNKEMSLRTFQDVRPCSLWFVHHITLLRLQWHASMHVLMQQTGKTWTKMRTIPLLTAKIKRPMRLLWNRRNHFKFPHLCTNQCANCMPEFLRYSFSSALT